MNHVGRFHLGVYREFSEEGTGFASVEWSKQAYAADVNTCSIDCLGRGFSATPIRRLAFPVSYLEEARAEAVRDAVEIDEGEEIDGAKFGVDGGRTAEAAVDIEIGAEEAGSARGSGEFAGLLAAGGGVRFGSQGGLDQKFIAESMVEGHAIVLVLRGEGAAANEIARVAEGRVRGDAFPEKEEGGGIAVVLMDAGAA